LYVGNIPEDATEEELVELFAPHGVVDNVRILTGKHCAFVRFTERRTAWVSHTNYSRNPPMLRRYTVKMGWGKPDTSVASGRIGGHHQKENPPSNSVWLGGINHNTNEKDVSDVFSRFGNILSIRLLPDKTCGFVEFNSVDEATDALQTFRKEGLSVGGVSLNYNYGRSSMKSTPGISKSTGLERRMAPVLQGFFFFFFFFFSQLHLLIMKILLM